MGKITIEKDLFVGNAYWKYKADVKIKDGEIWDTDIIWMTGVGPDDESLPITDFIEEVIKTNAEQYANEQLGDILSQYNTVGIHDEEEE